MEGEVSDGSGQPAGKRVFCLYQPLAGEISQVNPAILWDHQPLQDVEAPPDVAELLQRCDAVEDYIVMHVLADFQAEIQRRRDHETGIKEKYGLRSLDFLIQESNQKIMEYDMRQAAGEAVDLPLRNEQRNLESLLQRKADLEREIRQERSLTIGEPRILGAAAVVPIREKTPPAPPDPQESDEPALIR
ncbi:MAG: helicase, partial [Verrucomicrobiae bacterium]|nr:helicase [Verrucomicrobiae bacterium]